MQLLLGIAAFTLCIHSLLYGYLSPEGWITSLFLALVVYLPHELGHISMGGKYKIEPIFMALSMLLTYLRLPFILVGYVDYPSEENILKKASAGIIANICIALAGIFTMPIVVYPSLVFAFSNLYPFFPLDGYYIWKKSKAGWAILMFILLILVLSR
jgi:Zn-dependent protease